MPRKSACHRPRPRNGVAVTTGSSVEDHASSFDSCFSFQSQRPCFQPTASLLLLSRGILTGTLPQSVLTPAHSSCLTASSSNVANLYRGQPCPRCGVVAHSASFSLPGFLTSWDFSTDLWVCQGSDNHYPELGCTSQFRDTVLYKIPSLLSLATLTSCWMVTVWQFSPHRQV